MRHKIQARTVLGWQCGPGGLVICFDSLPFTREAALSVTFGASSPTGGAEGTGGTDETNYEKSSGKR